MFPTELYNVVVFIYTLLRSFAKYFTEIFFSNNFIGMPQTAEIYLASVKTEYTSTCYIFALIQTVLD